MTEVAGDTARRVAGTVERLREALAHEPELVTLLLPASVPEPLVGAVRSRLTESHPRLELETVPEAVPHGSIHVLVE